MGARPSREAVVGGCGHLRPRHVGRWGYFMARPSSAPCVGGWSTCSCAPFGLCQTKLRIALKPRGKLQMKAVDTPKIQL